MISILGSALALYAGLIAVMYVGQRSLMYQPGRHVATPAESGVAEMQAIVLKTADGFSLTSWYAPAHPGKPTIVYVHGNAGTISDRGYKLRPLLDQGYGAALVGYRGYGGNPGSPTEAGLYTDAETMIDHLRAGGVPAADIILFGESLGTGVAVEIAARAAIAASPVKAVILEAPFTSMGDAAQTHYPFIPAKFLVKDRYESIAKISAIKASLYLYHGDRDRVVSQTLGRRLFDAAVEPKTADWITGADHGNLYDFGAAAGILAFLARI